MSVVSTIASTSYSQVSKRDGLDTTNMSLSAFQAKYTSEDNESFNKVLDKQNKKRQEKYSWMWSGNKIPSARQIAHRQREAKRIAAQGNPESNNSKHLTGSDYDCRPAKPDSWKSRPENSLMFIPPSVEDIHETVQQKAEAASRAGRKQVVHSNTRLQPVTPTSMENPPIPPSPSMSAIRDAIAGKPRIADSEAGFSGGEMPQVNGYSFVDEEDPDPDANADKGYHMRLLTSQTGDSTPNPFKIKENRKREDLHHRMVERVAKNKRSEKVARATKTPIPRFPGSPIITFGRTPGDSVGQTGPAVVGASKANLTPAAQRLWASVGSKPKHATPSATGLKNMWTPTPRRAK
jgi:protein DGCR14